MNDYLPDDDYSIEANFNKRPASVKRQKSIQPDVLREKVCWVVFSICFDKVLGIRYLIYKIPNTLVFYNIS